MEHMITEDDIKSQKLKEALMRGNSQQDPGKSLAADKNLELIRSLLIDPAIGAALAEKEAKEAKEREELAKKEKGKGKKEKAGTSQPPPAAEYTSPKYLWQTIVR